MRYGSLFTGIGGFDLALDRCGMECVWQVEINPHRREVLKSHWPDVERFEDVREVGRHNLKPVDLICGGFPCQDLSVAGKRGGLKAERSGLFFKFARIVGELQPTWFIIENVFGLLSSEAGRDFTIVLSTLDDLGYGLAWRVLDSRYFGVAQRRRRVYVVGYLGAPCPYEVLFESEGCCGDTAEGGEAGKGTAAEVAGRIRSGGCGGVPSSRGENLAVTLSTTHGGGRRRCDDENLVAGESLSYALRGSRRGQFSGSQAPDDSGVRDNREQARGVGQTPERSGGAPGHGEEVDPNRVRETPGVPRRVDLPVREEPGEECIAFEPGIAKREGNESRFSEGICPTLRKDMDDNQPAVCIKSAAIGRKPEAGPQRGEVLDDGTTYTLNATEVHACLTPWDTQSMRVQSEDGVAPAIGNTKTGGEKGLAVYVMEENTRDESSAHDPCTCPDTPRYQALGDAVTVNVVEWIGRRIAEVSA
ncbi:MAG: DNA cytosine methyltransferase [Sphaerochaeta sp.]|jgi:DNA (cytosine-5)-methyltransferase 1|nr:DNA cytosine methyltransferase [Sphaerochaeta sp.]